MTTTTTTAFEPLHNFYKFTELLIIWFSSIFRETENQLALDVGRGTSSSYLFDEAAGDQFCQGPLDGGHADIRAGLSNVLFRNLAQSLLDKILDSVGFRHFSCGAGAQPGLQIRCRL